MQIKKWLESTYNKLIILVAFGRWGGEMDSTVDKEGLNFTLIF